MNPQSATRIVIDYIYSTQQTWSDVSGLVAQAKREGQTWSETGFGVASYVEEKLSTVVPTDASAAILSKLVSVALGSVNWAEVSFDFAGSAKVL